MKQLICLDMDNTLLDADKAHAEAYNKAFVKNNLNKVSIKKLKKLFGMDKVKLVKKIYSKLNKKKLKKIVKDHNYFLINDTKKYLRPFKGIKKTLRTLKKRYKLALLSNCSHEEILASLKESKLSIKLFDVIVGSDEVKRSKPYPDLIFKAEKKLKLKTTYMIGDTIYDIIAGKKAKTKTIAILSGNYTRKMLKKEQPDYIIKDINKLTKII